MTWPVRYDVYLAGPFFNDYQKSVMDQAKGLLLKHGFKVADPRELGPVIVDMPKEKRTHEVTRGIFDGNIKAMENSIFMLAWADEKDTGTAFELGFAYARRCLTTFTFSVCGKQQNVMIAHAVDGHFNGFANVDEWLRKTRSYISQNKGIGTATLMAAPDFTMKVEPNE